jgi:xanthine dehydrogenase accessory factor
MNSIAETAGKLLEHRRRFALATIVSRHGSTPRTAGTRMIVTAEDPPIGTIGGGLLEARVLQKARGVLASGLPSLVPFDLSHSDVAAMDMICGGRLDVLLEVVEPGSPAAAAAASWSKAVVSPDPSLFMTLIRIRGSSLEGVTHGLVRQGRLVSGDLDLEAETLASAMRGCVKLTQLQTVPLGESLLLVDPVLPAETVFLFGAGHVAQPTARLAKIVGFRVVVVDDRPEFANSERFPDADDIRVVKNFDVALKLLDIDHRGYIVIVTRGHLHDRTVLMQALRTAAGYVGMIGSRRKRDHIFNSLRKEGVTQNDIGRVHAPIGLDIGGESCEEIAVSIVAELVQVRSGLRGA